MRSEDEAPNIPGGSGGSAPGCALVPNIPGGSGGSAPGCALVPNIPGGSGGSAPGCALYGLLAVVACGGTAHQITIAPPPAKDTHAVLTGGLCQDNRCTCRGETGD